VTYDIAFGNEPGAGKAAGVVVTDSLPLEIEFISADAGGVYDPDAHAVVWTEDLVAGETIEPTVVGRIGAGVPGETWLTNTLALAWDQMEPLLAEASLYVLPPPPLFLAKVVEPLDQRPGGLVTYTLVFGKKLDDGASLAIVMVDALPPEIEFVWGSAGGVYNPSTHEITWSAELAPAQPMTVTLVGRIGTEVAGGTWLTNHARLEWAAGFLEADASHYVLHALYLPMIVRGE
jgi:uncharacterized repeat protein (TIGR01451 family)